MHLLPEPQLSGGLPECIDLVLVACFQQLIVDDKQGVSRHIVGEGREVNEAGHVVWGVATTSVLCYMREADCSEVGRVSSDRPVHFYMWTVRTLEQRTSATCCVPSGPRFSLANCFSHSVFLRV